MFDVEMLCMDGFDFFEKLMCLWLMLVVMVLLLIECGLEIMLCVFEFGVVDFVMKLCVGICDGMFDYVEKFVDKICVVLCVCVC